MKKIMVMVTTALAITGCISSCKNVQQLQLAGSWSIEKAMGLSTATCEKPPYINFEDNKVHGNASVNLFNGMYTLKGNKLTFSRIGMTMMMGASMNVEAAITDAMNKTAFVMPKGDKMYLLDARKDTVMTLVRKQ